MRWLYGRLVPERWRQEARRFFASLAELRAQLDEWRAQLSSLRQDLSELALQLSQTKAGVSAIQGQTNEAFTHIIVLRQELSQKVSELGRAGAALALELSQTKAGVSAIQGQSGETLSHIVVLRRELSELAGRPGGERGNFIAQKQISQGGVSPGYDDLRTLPRLLDAATARQLEKSSALATTAREDHLGLAAHYARMADLVSRYWIRRREPPQDLFPDDDFSVEFASKAGIKIPEAYTPKIRGSVLPWRHLWFDPDCAILLILGETATGHNGQDSGLAADDVFVFDFLRMQCLRPAAFPSESTNQAFWNSLGNLVIQNGMCRRVLIVSLHSRYSLVNHWIPGGSMQRATSLVFSRLRKELGLVCLPFSAVLWQQGQADASHMDMSAVAYKMHFHDAIADLRANGVFAPVFVALSSLDILNHDECSNTKAIRHAQSDLPDPTCGVFSGPDLDSLVNSDNSDSNIQAAKSRDAAELWASTLAGREGLFERIPSHL